MPGKLFLFTVMSLVLCTSAVADEKQDRKKLKAVSADILKIQRSLQSGASKRDNLVSELQQAEVERAQIRHGVNKLETQLFQLNNELKQLNKKQAGLQRDQQRQQQLIQSQVNTAYRLGRQEPVKLLLNQEDPERLTRTLKYYDYFLTARANKLNSYTETLNELARVEHNISSKTAQLNQHRDQLKRQQHQLDERQQQRKSVMAALNKEISSNQQRLKKLQQEQTRLEAVLKALTQAISDIASPVSARPFTSYRGKMQWPIKGKLRHSFGSRRNSKMNWDGWMLSAKEGIPVKAIHSGRVVFSDYLRGYGLLVIIDHGDDYMSLYAHNQVLLKETGDWVTSREAVAKTGNSGGQAESGLYFEIRHRGKPTNPKRWLASS